MDLLPKALNLFAALKVFIQKIGTFENEIKFNKTNQK